MNKIVCPNCKKAFELDEAGFADILKQVRDEAFNNDIQERERMFATEKENAVKLAEVTLKNALQSDIAKKDIELAE